MSQPPLPSGDSMETMYGPAAKVQTREEAAAYMAELVRLNRAAAPEQTEEQALAVQRHNLGYFGGYLAHEDRVRLESLFEVVHPFFGPASAGPVSPEVAFALGQKEGMKRAQQQEH